jgi:outer membrane protein TolC
MKYLLATMLGMLLMQQPLQAQLVFNRVDSLLRYAGAQSITLQSGTIRLDQAKKGKLAALLSIPDLSGNLSFSYTHNTRLPVNLFPAEVFGGQPGTFREVASGLPYVSNGNENIDLKLLNLKNWENLKLYKLNIEQTLSDNTITRKSLYENIVTQYFNIVTLQEQAQTAIETRIASDTLLKITERKYNSGLVRQQDVNDAKVNYLTAAENAEQLRYLIEQQYLALKILCDIPEATAIEIRHARDNSSGNPKRQILLNNIAFNNSVIKERIARSDYRQQKYALYPTISFFQSYTTQQFNTRGKLFDNTVKWIPSSYIGLRLSITIPNSNTITQLSKAKYDYLLAQRNTEQQKIKAVLEAKKLDTEYEKAISQEKSCVEIYLIRKDTYEKNLNLYMSGLIPFDQTINSFTALVNSKYNLIAARITVQSAKEKIEINNTIQ